MTALSISAPFPIFSDIDGDPLDSGYIYIGATNQNPVTNPITVYWDAALTVPAAQPIRTSGGYPQYNGTAANLYVNSDYSIRVTNKNGTLVYSAAAATARYDSALVSYLPAGTGAVPTTVQAKLRESVSLQDFGAAGDGSDATTALNNLIAEVTDGAVVTVFGDFLISSTVVINKSIRFVSAGKGYQGGRFLNLTDTALTMFSVVSHGVEFDSVEIRGAGKTGTSKGIVVGDGSTNKDNFVFNGSVISYFKTGIETKTQNWSIRNGSIVSTCGTGVLMTGLPTASDRRDCYLSNSSFHSCDVGISAPNVWHSVGITDNDFGSCIDGISGYFARSQIKNNNFPNSTGTEISVSSATSSTNEGLQVTGNIIYPGAGQLAGKSGIVFTGDYGTISGNIVSEKTGHGISVTGSTNQINENTTKNNDSGDTSSYDGVYVAGNSNNVQNNISRTTTGGTAKQRYGINIASGSSNVVKNNIVNSNKSAQINDSGSGTTIKLNTGYVTENKGSTTVLNGNTSVTVTHGLAVTPPSGSIQIAPMFTNNPLITRWWISAVTSTTFTITLNADPGATQQAFGWQIMI
jgi:parallel beta-helix repeat protein